MFLIQRPAFVGGLRFVKFTSAHESHCHISANVQSESSDFPRTIGHHRVIREILNLYSNVEFYNSNLYSLIAITEFSFGNLIHRVCQTFDCIAKHEIDAICHSLPDRIVGRESENTSHSGGSELFASENLIIVETCNHTRYLHSHHHIMASCVYIFDMKRTLDTIYTTYPLHMIAIAIPNRSYTILSDSGYYKGYDIDYLKIISEAIGKTYSLVESEKKDWGVLDKNGTWSGMIGEVVAGHADFGLGDLTVNLLRYKYIDFTVWHNSNRYCVVGKKVATKPIYFLALFNLQVMMLWLVAIVVITCVVCMLAYHCGNLLGFCDICGGVLDIIRTQFRQGLSNGFLLR